MSVYDERPWLALYPEGQSADIRLEYDSGLAMFRAAVERAPDRPLLVYFDGQLTTRDVDELTDALAVSLLEGGFSAGDRLAAYLQNTPAFVLAMIATWKAGGIMVSINPMNRQREVELLLTDSGAKVLLSQDDLYRDVASEVVAGTSVQRVITTSPLDFQTRNDERLFGGIERIRSDGTEDLLELMESHRGASPPDVELQLDDTAFLTYTSGTTGPPKGARNTHRNVVFNAQVYRDWVGLDESDRVFGVAPLFHITGLIGHVAVCLLVPMPLILTYRFQPNVVLDALKEHRPTFTVGSITVFTALMTTPGFEKDHFSSFKAVYSGGAPIAPATANRFLEAGGVYIHNIYGLTETTSPSHGVPFGAEAPVDETSGALSVGVPVFNTTVRIQDDDGKDLPAGEVGEIVTEGPQVVAGYWNKPEETEKALPGGSLHTGDVGFMDSQGWYYIVDRKKDQINASGYKVWPREVEDVLAEHPAVKEAAVVGVPDEYRGESVKAFVSLNAGQSTDEKELIAFCKERMAAYKYPRQVELIDELPKTVTGKILRRQLRDVPRRNRLRGFRMSEQIFTYGAPLLKFGPGSAAEIGFDLSQYGASRVLVVTDSGVAATGWPHRVAEQMKEFDLEAGVFDRVHVEPTDDSLREAVDWARESGPWDAFVAVGGGSSIDTAKAINLMTTNPGELEEYINAPVGGGKNPSKPLNPLVAVPTTTGTGSESTTICVLDVLKLHVKTGISHARLRPTMAVVDPLLTMTQPPGVTAATGMDILCHALESYTAKPYTSFEAKKPDQRVPYCGSNPVADMWSEKALQLLSRSFRTAYREGDDLDARMDMAMAATFAGLGFGNAGVHIPHANAYPIAGRVRDFHPKDYPADEPMVPHGMSVALTAPEAFRFTFDAQRDRHLKVAELLSGSSQDELEPAERLPQALMDLMRDIEIPNGIGEVGFGENDVDDLVDGTMKQQRLLATAPKDVHEEDVAGIFTRSLELW